MYENHTLLGAPELRVLDIFLDLKKHYFAELVNVTKLTRPRTLRVLRKLVRQGALEVMQEANVKYYSLQKSSLVHSLLSSVEYNRSSVFLKKHKTLQRAVEMFKEKYTNHQLFLIFGSIVKGYASSESDIDILLIKETFSKKEIRRIEDIIDLVNGRTGLKISPHLMDVEEFKKRNDLAKEAIEKHILIDGAEQFFRWISG